MQTGLRLTASVLLLWLHMMTLATGEEVGLVALPAGSTFELGAECPSPHVLVPVAPQPDLNNTVKPQVFAVRLGNQSDEMLRQAFEAGWVKNDSAADVQAIKLTVKNYAAVARPGTYDITLRLLSTQDARALKLVKLQVIHPPAKLRSPLDTLIVERTRYLLGWDHPSYIGSTKLPLALTETSNHSCLTELRVQPMRNAAIGGRQVTGHLHFSSGGQGLPAAQLAAGGNLTIGYEPVGDFPLGVVKGTLEVTAAELNDALPLSFEVRSRLWSGYLVIFIVAGLVVSYFLKVKLQRDIALGEARDQALKTLELAQTEYERRLDGDFRKAIEAEFAALQATIDGNDAAVLAKTNDDLDKALRAALQNLAARRQTLQKQVDELLTVTNNMWEVPPAIQAVLSKANQAMDEIVQHLANDDIGQAQKESDLLKGNLTTELRDAVSQWQRDIRSYLNDLAAATQGIPSVVKAAFAKMVDQVTPVIGIAKLSNTPAATEIVQALRDLSIELRHARDVLQKLHRALETETAQVEHILANLQLQNPNARIALNASLAALQAEVGDFCASLDQSAEAPDTAASKLATQLSALHDSWRDAVLGQVPQASQAAITQYLDQQEYVKAAQQAADILTGAGILLGPQEIVAPPGLEWRLAPGLDLAPAVATFRTVTSRIETPSRQAVIRAQTQRNLRRAKLAQSFLIGLLLVILGYGLYWEKFIGNFADFSQIFFWAFGLDITLDTVLKTIPKKA